MFTHILTVCRIFLSFSQTICGVALKVVGHTRGLTNMKMRLCRRTLPGEVTLTLTLTLIVTLIRPVPTLPDQTGPVNTPGRTNDRSGWLSEVWATADQMFELTLGPGWTHATVWATQYVFRASHDWSSITYLKNLIRKKYKFSPR